MINVAESQCKPPAIHSPPVIDPIAIPPGLPPLLREYATNLAAVDVARRRLHAAEAVLPVASAERRQAEAEFEAAVGNLAESRHDLAAVAVAGIRIAGIETPAALDTVIGQIPVVALLLATVQRQDEEIALLKKALARFARKRRRATA